MPGRPRDPARHEAVLAATRALLAEVGYDALTFSDVAARAGVTRPLVYRWWPAKPSLVSEALFHDTRWPVRYPGPLEKDLRSFVSALVDYARRPEVRSGLLGIMAEARDVSELPALASLVEGLQASFGALLEAGSTRGETRGGIDLVMTLDTLRGAVTAHVIADARPRKLVVDHLVQLLTWALSSPISRSPSPRA